MLVKLRVMLAEVKQPYQKDMRDLDAAEKFLLMAIQRNLKDDVFVHAKKVAHAKRRMASFEKVVQAVDHIRENAKFICDQAAADKTKPKMCPEEYAPSFRMIVAVADALRVPSFVKFKQDIIPSLYSKQALAALSDRSQLDDVVRQGLYDDPIDNADMAKVFAEFAQKYLDDYTPLEKMIGYSLASVMGGAPGSVPQGQQVAYGGKRTYKMNEAIFVPMSLPEFPKAQWATLAQQVYEATA